MKFGCLPWFDLPKKASLSRGYQKKTLFYRNIHFPKYRNISGHLVYICDVDLYSKFYVEMILVDVTTLLY